MTRLDVRLTLRALRRTPWFTATSILVFALGIGGSTLVFSVVHTLLLRQLPYSDSERLVTVEPPLSHWPIFEQLRRSQAYDRIGGYAERSVTIRLAQESRRVLIAAATDGFLQAAGTKTVVGRVFAPEEFQRGGERVVLLTAGLWRSEFQSTPDVLGQTVVLDDIPYSVVGVLSESFRTLGQLEAAGDASYDRDVVAIVPGGDDLLNALARRGQATRPLTVIGRLRPGVGIRQARDELASILQRTPPPGHAEGLNHQIAFVSAAVAQNLPNQLTLLSVGVAVLLLVACANVANLLLGRGEERRKELAVRVAMGASVAALARTLLLEAVSLAVAGGASGVFLAWAGMRMVRSVSGGLLTRLDELALDPAQLMFAAVVSLVAGLLAGAVPAIRLARTDVGRWLQVHATTPSNRGRLPIITRLVIAEVALSILLVVVGALLARDFAGIAMIDLGFRPRGVLTATITLERHRALGPNAGLFFSNVLERVSSLPGVAGAAFAATTPGGRAISGIFGEVEGRRPGPIMGREVTADYFSLLGIPIVAGRAYSRDDARGGSRLLVVGEEFARAYWGSPRAAVGKRIVRGTIGRQRTAEEFQRDAYRVIGVASDPKEHGWESRTSPVVYWLDRLTGGAQRILLLRPANGSAGSLAAPLRALIHSIDPYQPVSDVRSLDDIVSARLVRPRLLVGMMIAFATLTLTLACAGVHGMIAYLVALRRREMAVRLALGSTRAQVLRLVLAHTLKLLALGIVLGVPMTWALVSFSAARIFAVSGVDSLTCFSATALVVVVGLAASLAPAWRVSGLESLAALKEE